jgi:hypothetical protein
MPVFSNETVCFVCSQGISAFMWGLVVLLADVLYSSVELHVPFPPWNGSATLTWKQHIIVPSDLSLLLIDLSDSLLNPIS